MKSQKFPSSLIQGASNNGNFFKVKNVDVVSKMGQNAYAVNNSTSTNSVKFF